MKKIIFTMLCGFLSLNLLASSEAYKPKMEEILDYSIEDKTVNNPKFQELQQRILELRYSDGGDLQRKTGELINLTLQLYPNVDLNSESHFIVYGMGDLLYVYAAPDTYDNRRFIYDDKGLIEWASNWYNTEPGKVDFLNDRMDKNIIYCAGQKIVDTHWGISYGTWVVKEYRYVPNSEAVQSLSFFKNGALIKTIQPQIANDPNDFRKKIQAATVNDTYQRVYDLDPDMISYSQIRLLIHESLRSQ